MTEHATCNVCKTLHVARPSYSASSLILWRSFTLSVIRDSRTSPESARVSLIGQWLVPFGSSSPLVGPVIVHRPCKVLGLGFRFSPVTDAIGRIRRCQRSICVTASLPVPRQGKEKFILRRISPRTLGMIAKRRFCVNCRDRQKTQIPHRVCKHGAESLS